MVKKIGLLLVILTLLFNMLPAHAQTSNSALYVETAQRIGIVNGYSDGSLRVDALISRAEFAAIVYRVKTGKLSSAPVYTGTKVFNDVSEKDWSYGYIYYCYNLSPKLLAGYPDGTFRPKNIITNAEAIKVFTQILYQGEAPLIFPYGYIAKAKELGLLNGIENLDWIQPATRAIICRLAVNVLTCSSESVAEQTAILLKNFGISTYKCKIIGAKGNHAENFNLTKSFVAEIRNSYGIQLLTVDLAFNVEEFIGYNVLLFFKDKNSNKILDTESSIAVWSNGSIYQINIPIESVVTVVKTNIKTLSGKLSDIKMFVSNTDGSFMYKNKEYFYSRDAVYIVNGKVIDKGSKGESRFEGFYGSAQGTFTMVDTNEDDIYDSCLIFAD